MTAFLIAAAVMLAAGLLWVLLPLARSAPPEGSAPARQRALMAAVAALLPVLAIGLYASFSSWDWETAERMEAEGAETDALLAQLQTRLESNPDDVQGWLLLGRSYTATGRFGRAVDAYQHAYDLTRGENVEATIGLGEALVLSDETALGGRAGGLFEDALARSPDNPKALWYGSMAALQRGDLRTGRNRLQLLLSLNPPEEVRSLIERQVQDLNQQLGEAGESGEGAAGESFAAGKRVIRVAVSIAPHIQDQLREPLTLFVLARDPAGGPPLAVQRHSSSAVPLTVELGEGDAMMPARTLASVPRVEVVARLSQSGTPQEQSGDFYGAAEHEFSAGDGTLSVVIDRIVP